eukprot:5846346-Pleurochrysis_carterae.AAC.2
MPCLLNWGRANDLREQPFRASVSMEQAVLPAFFIIQHNLDGSLGSARPLRVGRRAAVADQ